MSGRIVVISGYFNPIHSGHLDYIQEAKKLGDFLVVIVNNDDQVKIKGSIPFMDEEERARIVSSIKGVDYTYISTRHFILPLNFYNEFEMPLQHLLCFPSIPVSY